MIVPTLLLDGLHDRNFPVGEFNVNPNCPRSLWYTRAPQPSTCWSWSWEFARLRDALKNGLPFL